MRSRRGHILLMILLVFMLMMALVAGIASTAYLFQRTVDSYSRERLAQNLGDSLIATAAARLRKSSDFSARIDLQDAQVDARSKAWLTFDPGDPDHSTNNILGDGSKEGFRGSVVPAGTAELVAAVNVRGRTYHVVYLIGKSPFPYVVASSGDFYSNGPLLMGALRSLDDLKDGLTPDDLVKGSLLSNQSLTINAPADVIGDLKTHTSASLAGVNHDGKLEVNADQEDIPKIQISNYDPAGKPEIIEYTTPPKAGVKLELSGLARASLNVVLNEGLSLNGGVLYVDGDLTIGKGVNGFGAVFCTGTLKVSGGSDLGSDSLCALVAGKDLSLKGDSASTTQFRGLVYSGGAMTVSDVTVVGALVGNSPNGATMTVDRANLVYDPKAVNLEFDLQFSGFGEFTPLNGGVQLPRDSKLTPASLFGRDGFRPPTREELKQGLLFKLPGRTARRWDELSDAEQRGDAAQTLLSKGSNIVAPQIDKWNHDKLNPQTVSAQYHLDLNRFVKIQSAVRTLMRQLYGS